VEKIAESLYKALRDDSEATVGIRALLGNTTTTPYNVYHVSIPAAVDFVTATGSQSFIVYQFVSGTPDQSFHGRDGLAGQELYSFRVYSRTLSTLESVCRRMRLRLRKKYVTDPTTQAVILEIKMDSEGATIWDDEFKVWGRTVYYRVWMRDDNLY